MVKLIVFCALLTGCAVLRLHSLTEADAECA